MTRPTPSYLAAVALVLLSILGCGGGGVQADLPSPAPADQPHPTPRPAPTVTLADGFTLTVELASTQEEIARGLMFRPSLAEDRGMLFLFGQERMPSFWMKDTLIPLDIIFLDRSGRVVDIAAEVQPCRTEPCPQYVPKRPAAAVLEAASGTAAAHGIAVGDQLTFARVPDFPLAAR